MFKIDSMLKYAYSLGFVFAIISTVFSQNSDTKHLNNFENNSRIVLPIFNNAHLRTAEQERINNEGGALGFAQSHITSISTKTHGNWKEISDDQLLWTLHIKSPNAFSLNLGFTKFYLPQTARLKIFTPDQKTVLGPFTSSDNDDHGQFWTPLLDGDEVVLKLVISPQQINALDFELGYVNHDYLGFGKAVLSGSCNLDVICGAADGWPEVDLYRDIIRSAGAYFFQSVNGTSICSGALINNARQDCTPYFLTANHCGINQNNSPSFVFVWNYENSFCRQPNSSQSGQAGDGQKSQFNSGAILRASYDPSDMTLVEMDDPIDLEVKPFFAGWNAESTLPQSTICIHHPGVEEKRISFDYEAPIYNISGNDTTHVRVLDWDVGTTEGGSSGSPLFNNRKQIIGKLTGGGAACGNDDSDNYGWVHRSWEGGGTPGTRLKDWLDPDGLGILQMGGRNCGFGVSLSTTSSTICAEENSSTSFTLVPNEFVDTTVHINILSFPNGSLTSSDKDSLLIGEMATITIANLDLVNSGIYHIIIEVSSHTDVSLVYFNLTLTNQKAQPPSPVQPEQNAMGVHFIPSFYWDSPDGISWDFELSSDSNFENTTVFAPQLDRRNYSVIENLELNSDYYWRVRAVNDCGLSDWSEVYIFTTGNIDCIEISASDLPIMIGEQVDTIRSSVFVHNGGIIKDLNMVNVSGVHSWTEDLIFTLTGPGRQQVILLSGECGSNNDFNFNIDDESELARVSCPLNQGITYPPIDPLSLFDDTNPRGLWTLEVEDVADFDGGSLENWGMLLCLDITNDFSAPHYPEDLVSCKDTELQADIFIGAGFNGLVDLTTINDQNNIATFSPNPANPGALTTMTLTALSDLLSGVYTFSYTASDGINSTETTVTLTVDNEPEFNKFGFPAGPVDKY